MPEGRKGRARAAVEEGETVKVPCKDCQQRTAECHASCKQYAEYRAEREAAYNARKLEYTLSINPRAIKGKTEKLKRQHRRG